MTMHDHSSDQHQRESALSLRSLLAIGAFFTIAGFLLFSEHRAHILGALVWLLPFACLFLHSFMHGGHGHHHRHRDAPPDSTKPGSTPEENTND